MDALKRAVVVGVTTGTLLLASSVSMAAFEIRKSGKPNPEVTQAVFDESEFSTWVDNTYLAVVTYGSHTNVSPAPSFGDEMPLSDALKLLAPDQWKVMRSKNLDLEGRLVVSWDLQDATWLDALRNLGERHGFQFHVDFNRKQVFVKNGRKLIFDRPMALGLAETYPAASPGRVFDKDGKLDKTASGTVITTKTFVNLNDDKRDESVFTLQKGESARIAVEDLALIFGYEKFHWLMGEQRVERTGTYVGDARHIMGQVVSEFSGRLCLYEADKVAAVIPKNMECPTDE